MAESNGASPGPPAYLLNPECISLEDATGFSLGMVLSRETILPPGLSRFPVMAINIATARTALLESHGLVEGVPGQDTR